MDEYTTFDDFIAKIKSRDDVDGVAAYRRVKDVSNGEDSGDMDVVALDDNSSYEKQWAEAIDQALADAALEAFKNNIRDCITSVLKQDASDRHLKWLQAQMNKKIDILDKIIHLSKTEVVPHEERGNDSRREAEEKH